jgi:hypothetical protein
MHLKSSLLYKSYVFETFEYDYFTRTPKLSNQNTINSYRPFELSNQNTVYSYWSFFLLEVALFSNVLWR